MRLRAALASPSMRDKAAVRYAKRALPDSANPLQAQLIASATKSLTIFAGEIGEQKNVAGFVAVAQFLEKIPAAEQTKAADVFMRILNECLWDLWQIAREQEGLNPLEHTENTISFCNWRLPLYLILFSTLRLYICSFLDLMK